MHTIGFQLRFEQVAERFSNSRTIVNDQDGRHYFCASDEPKRSAGRVVRMFYGRKMNSRTP
jgi:hypothetical protein